MKDIRLLARPLNRLHSHATSTVLQEVKRIKLMLVGLFSVLRFSRERKVIKVSLTMKVIVLGMEATFLSGCGESNNRVLSVIDQGSERHVVYNGRPPSIGIWQYKDGHLYDYQIINGELIRRKIW